MQNPFVAHFRTVLPGRPSVRRVRSSVRHTSPHRPWPSVCPLCAFVRSSHLRSVPGHPPMRRVRSSVRHTRAFGRSSHISAPSFLAVRLSVVCVRPFVTHLRTAAGRPSAFVRSSHTHYLWQMKGTENSFSIGPGEIGKSSMFSNLAVILGGIPCVKWNGSLCQVEMQPPIEFLHNIGKFLFSQMFYTNSLCQTDTATAATAGGA